MGAFLHAHDDDITEQADNPGLIDTKGRGTTPDGKILDADPIVSAPFVSRGYSRYTYVSSIIPLLSPTDWFRATTRCGIGTKTIQGPNGPAMRGFAQAGEGPGQSWFVHWWRSVAWRNGHGGDHGSRPRRMPHSARELRGEAVEPRRSGTPAPGFGQRRLARRLQWALGRSSRQSSTTTVVLVADPTERPDREGDR